MPKFLLKSNLASLPIPKSGTVSSATAVRLTTGAQTVEGVNVSRDGKWIVYDSNRSGNQDIYKMLRTGGPEEQLTHNPQDDFLPNWSPDGQFIAFYSFRNGNRDIYVMSADGTNQQQVTNDPAQERYPDWSPDGQSLVFFSDKTGQQEIYRVSRENGKWGLPVRLTFTETGAYEPPLVSGRQNDCLRRSFERAEPDFAGREEYQAVGSQAIGPLASITRRGPGTARQFTSGQLDDRHRLEYLLRAGRRGDPHDAGPI